MQQLRIDLSRLLRPRSIAVFGGREAEEVVQQCQRMNFGGPIWPVHPKREQVGGLRCYRSVADLPQVPDAAFIGVNRHLTIDIVRELATRGAGGAIAYASGFGEVADGVELQSALIEASGQMPVIGPNCYGFINYFDGALLWPDQHGGQRTRRGVAILTQSSNIAINLTMQRRALPIGYVMALGNQAKLGLSDCMGALIDDGRVTAIGLHIEGIDDPGKFERVAFRALERRIPIVALKVGRSQAGARLTLSHTASLAGVDAVVDAFLRRCGVARVHSLTAFIETLKLLHCHGPLPGNAIASMSCSGGEATLMADAAEGRSVVFRDLSDAEVTAIKSTLSDLVTVSNPLDYHTFIWGDRPRMAATFSAMMGCGFDLTMLVLDYPRSDRCDPTVWEAAAGAMVDAARKTGAKAAVVATLPECLPEADAQRYMEEGIAPLMGIEDALTAAEAAAQIGAALRRPRPAASARALGPAGAGEVVDEARSKALLAGYGLTVPEGRLVTSATEGAEAAEELGFPVVVKAVGPAIQHKTELGAVAIGLGDKVAVRGAIDRMSALSDTFLVERMIGDCVAELIVGANRDPRIGPYLVVGSGGVLVELVKDRRILLLPATRDEILEAVMSLRAARLLEGFRGGARGDIAGAVGAVEAIARFVEDYAERVAELDVNPLMVRRDGLGAVAVDALIKMA
jgi:acetyl-CoA synthetase